jgi:hypothetical protein
MLPSTPSASVGRLRTRRGRWLLLRLAATLGLGTSTRSSRGRSSLTSSDSSSTRLVLSSSSRQDRARGFQRLLHALLHRLHQLRGKECLLLLPGSNLQHSHGCVSTVASRDTTQRLSLEGAVWTAGAPSSAQGSLSGQGEPRDGRVSGRGSQRGYWYVHG